MRTPETYRAVILDSQPLWLEAIERVLGRADVQTVAKVVDPAAAIVAVDEWIPNVLVAEPEAARGEVDGIEAIRRARQSVPEMTIVALSASGDTISIRRSFAAGASAYIVRTASEDDFAAAIRQALERCVYITPPDLAAVFGAPEANAVEVPQLTKREREILALAAEGRSNAQLAKTLWVTEQTVKFHLSNVYRKLGVTNRTEASRWAQLHGLLAEVSDGALLERGAA